MLLLCLDSSQRLNISIKSIKPSWEQIHVIWSHHNQMNTRAHLIICTLYYMSAADRKDPVGLGWCVPPGQWRSEQAGEASRVSTTAYTSWWPSVVRSTWALHPRMNQACIHVRITASMHILAADCKTQHESQSINLISSWLEASSTNTVLVAGQMHLQQQGT